MANTLNVEMPPKAQTDAIDHLVEAWLQMKLSGFSEWMVWELQKLVHAAVGEATHSRLADPIMNLLESGTPTRRAFERVIENGES